MTWYTPKTWTSGDLLTATDMNRNNRSNLYHLSAQKPRCHLLSQVPTAVETEAWTEVLFTGASVDTGGMFDAAADNTMIAIKEAGVFMVGGQAWWQNAGATPANTSRSVKVQRNRTNPIARDHQPRLQTAGVQQRQVVRPMLWPLSVNDAITLEVWQNSGTTLNIRPFDFTDYGPNLWVLWVGEEI